MKTKLRMAVGAVALLGIGVAFALAQTDSSIRGLQENLQQLRGEERELRSAITAKRREASVVQRDIRDVDARITAIHASLSSTDRRMANARSEIQRLSTEIEEAEAAMEERRDRAKARLRSLYKHGDTTMLSVLISSEDVGSLAARKALYERIAERDRRLFDSLRTDHEQLMRQREEQNRLTEELRTLRQQQVGEQARLATYRTEKAGYLKEIGDEQRQLEAELRQLEAESRAIAAEIQAYQRRMAASGQQVTPHTGRMVWPTEGRVTSPFGMRMHPVLRERRMHNGIDIGTRTGTPIVAAAPGRVITARYMNGYGNTVIIDHGGGISTLYAHCSQIFVSVDQMVGQGERIAAVGSTGMSTGPHLHFEVRVNGSPVDPMGYLGSR